MLRSRKLHSLYASEFALTLPSLFDFQDKSFLAEQNIVGISIIVTFDVLVSLVECNLILNSPTCLVLACVIKRVALWGPILKQDKNRIWDEK